MELAVLKYKDTSYQHEDMPDKWPAECVEIADGAALPGASWVRMTVSQFTSHRATYQSDYDTWWNNNRPNYEEGE